MSDKKKPLYLCVRTAVFLVKGRYYSMEFLRLKYSEKAVEELIQNGYLDIINHTPTSGDSYKHLEARVAMLEQKLK